MSDFQIKKNPKTYDAIIVGSGAGGGMSAYVLSQAGLKVLLLEAGPLYDPAKNVTQLKCPTNHLAGGKHQTQKLLVTLMLPMAMGIGW